MGLLLPPPFQQIIFCIFLCQPWKCKSLEKASHYSFCKNDAHSSFSPESARALHKSRNRGFTFHQSLYCNTGSGQPECGGGAQWDCNPLSLYQTERAKYLSLYLCPFLRRFPIQNLTFFGSQIALTVNI